MAWIDRLQREGARWAGRGIDLLFPPRCILCHEDIVAADPIASANNQAAEVCRGAVCTACIRAVSTDVMRCLRCGEAVSDTSDCRRCRGRPCDWDGIVVLAGYSDRLREAVLKAKHPASEDISAALATLLVRKHRVTITGWNIEAVVPVPMHWRRRALRRTSAADELARRMALLLHVPVWAGLRRHKATRMQNELPIEERRENVCAAFRAQRRMDGKCILLVDDVVTTGATLAACRRALVAAGAQAVFVAVVAKADRSVAQGDD
ncbi:MAG: phosphoribosyltransferase family protein [Planctomycetia bacterium]|nr:phosphoribosyltransferase family protein [Planctomycetia bacterium]